MTISSSLMMATYLLALFLIVDGADFHRHRIHRSTHISKFHRDDPSFEFKVDASKSIGWPYGESDCEV